MTGGGVTGPPEQVAVAAAGTGRHDPPSAGRRRTAVAGLALRAGLLVAAVVLVAAFHDRIAEWWDGLVGVRWSWVLLAAGISLLSMHCLVLQQRGLLRAGGGRVPLLHATTTIYAGNTISATVPVAGAAASAAYTYRRLHALGNSTALVGWALAVSGIVATATLAVVLAVGSALTGSLVGALGAFVATAAGVVPIVGVVLVLRHERSRTVVVRLVGRTAGVLARWVPALRGAHVDQRIDDLFTSLGAFRLGPATGGRAFLLALANWVLDIGCLALALVAVGAPVPWQGLVLAWAAGALVSSARLTPGGIGVVEAALVAALVAAGMPASQAVPAVLVYRLVSQWLLIGLGAVLLVATPGSPARRPRGRRGPAA
ncbi:lysylphosphatidylglycerol synthase transmembrane domain-containing protein [Modestobacter italicus]|uniref:lysylphosphatidylglycerol synthase transmembrane domain-containing protein n=1 Tax=Modestobacter italicus (strain DSM 44449 / CECT 9708 / BC 501) TaxID=2732864 RepID=UPI001C964F35|nr:YbhN family protein [Modestobacter italicus]